MWEENFGIRKFLQKTKKKKKKSRSRWFESGCLCGRKILVLEEFCMRMCVCVCVLTSLEDLIYSWNYV